RRWRWKAKSAPTALAGATWTTCQGSTRSPLTRSGFRVVPPEHADLQQRYAARGILERACVGDLRVGPSGLASPRLLQRSYPPASHPRRIRKLRLVGGEIERTSVSRPPSPAATRALRDARAAPAACSP